MNKHVKFPQHLSHLQLHLIVVQLMLEDFDKKCTVNYSEKLSLVWSHLTFCWHRPKLLTLFLLLSSVLHRQEPRTVRKRDATTLIPTVD